MNGTYLHVRSEQRGRICVLAVVGDMDSAVCEQFVQLVRSWAEQTMADSRRTAQVIAAAEGRMAESLIRLAGRRTAADGRLTALSEAAQRHAAWLREQARRSLPA